MTPVMVDSRGHSALPCLGQQSYVRQARDDQEEQARATTSA